GRGVAGRLLENLLRADERDLEPRLRLCPCLSRGRTDREEADPRAHCHYTPRNDLPKRRTTGRSEEVAELEVQLEGRRRSPEFVGAVEAVRPVDADGPERRDNAQSDAGAPVQTSRVEFARARPHVTGV